MNRACIRFPSCAEGWSRRRPTLAPSIPDHSLKLSAAGPRVSLEITLWPDYDRPRASSVCRESLTVRGCSEFLTEKQRGRTMTVYSGPVFDMAVNQFGVIAN